MTAYPALRYLVDVGSQQLVEAEIFDEITVADVQDWRATWKPEVDRVIAELKKRGIPRHQWPQSHHWDWESKAPPGLSIYENGYAVRCDGRLQGLMRVNSVDGRCRIAAQHGKDCIYIDFIETAPWNQLGFGASPRFALVGTVLVVAALHLSIDQGFKGRIGLHSLPQSDGWYRDHLGLTDFGLDPSRYQGRLKYFEGTEKTASNILNGVKFP